MNVCMYTERKRKVYNRSIIIIIVNKYIMKNKIK